MEKLFGKNFGRSRRKNSKAKVFIKDKNRYKILRLGGKYRILQLFYLTKSGNEKRSPAIINNKLLDKGGWEFYIDAIKWCMEYFEGEK